MTKSITLFYLLSFLIASACSGQQQKTAMDDKTNNPLLCDTTTGVCEIPTTPNTKTSAFATEQSKPVKIIYFTDPICSSCWGIEPQLRKLKLEYGNTIEIEYRMGGLLPDWSYNSGGISKPSDVAHHWDEVSLHYDMPIDGDVWLEDPLNSSYPPSIAFKAAQLQDEKKAVNFMRRIREMVFLEKKNITLWKHLSIAANETGLDTATMKTDYETKAKELFNADLELAKNMGVRGFPTMFFVDSLNNKQLVYGVKPYKEFEDAVTKTFSDAHKINYDKSWNSLFSKYPTLTRKEFSELSGVNKEDSEIQLQKLTDSGKLIQTTTKNGSIWKLKSVKH
jgi:putative protein-disulfide isomerase